MAGNDDIEDDFSVNKATSGPSRTVTRPTTTTTTTTTTTGPKTTANFDRNPGSNQSTTTNNNNNNKPSGGGITQPKPQALAKRTGPSSIIVSPRQKGNPILTAIKSMPWEYGDIPGDYQLGLTTTALFLSLKYHRLHPEYIYNRIKALQGKYALRVVLVMVDIANHEQPLKELSKTSLINNVTLVLCWSAAEGGRYLETFKTFENAAPTAIKQHQSDAYADRMVDFVTTPRSVNKTDAVALVSQFGSVRRAINARLEDVGMIAGWGEKKCQRWCASVREPFRIQRAAKRGLGREGSRMGLSREVSRAGTLSRDVTRGEGDEEGEEDGVLAQGETDADQRPKTRLAEELPVRGGNGLFVNDDDDDDGEPLAEAMVTAPVAPYGDATTVDDLQAASNPKKRKPNEDDDLNDGIMAALSKLRKNG